RAALLAVLGLDRFAAAHWTVRPERLALLDPEDAAPDGPVALPGRVSKFTDRKSTRLNSSHVKSSYAVLCLKKKSRELLFELQASSLTFRLPLVLLSLNPRPPCANPFPYTPLFRSRAALLAVLGLDRFAAAHWTVRPERLALLDPEDAAPDGAVALPGRVSKF